MQTAVHSDKIPVISILPANVWCRCSTLSVPDRTRSDQSAPHAKEKNKLCLRDLALIFAQASGRLKKEKQGRPRMPRRLRRLRVRHILRLLHLSVVVVQLGVELGRGLEI